MLTNFYFFSVQDAGNEEGLMPCCVKDREGQAERIEELESKLLGVQTDNRSLKAKCSHLEDKLAWAYEVMQKMFANYKFFDEDMHQSSKGMCYVRNGNTLDSK